MNYKNYYNDFDDFDKESQIILQSSYNSLISEKHFYNKMSQINKPLQKDDTMPLASSPASNISDWQTDEYVNLTLLTSKIRQGNSGMNDYILKYNQKEYSSNTQNKSLFLPEGNYIRLKAYLNSKTENVSVKWNQVQISHKINANKEKIDYKLHFFYENTHEEAIILETDSYEKFRELNLLLGYGDIDKYKDDYDYFLRNFANALQNESDGKRLKFLYQNIPETILENLYKSVDKNIFFNHLEILTKYDNDGIFSGWKDGSSAVIQIFKALKKSQNIVDYYREFPEKLNTIYYNLDGSSEYEGKQLSNRMILANVLLVLCMFSTTENKAVKTFTIGNGYKINTELFELGSIFGFGNSNASTFFLQQQKVEQQRVKIVPKEGDPNATETVTTDIDEGAQFHPLDMVYVIDINGGKEEIYLVPAIYLKAMADAEEWAVVHQNIRIAANLVAIVIGVVTLATTGNPYFILLATADITLAGADITIQAFKEEIAQYEGGAEFLAKWEQVYMKGGFAIAGLTLVGGFYIGAARLLTKVADGSAKTYLKTLVLKAVLETNITNFTKDTIKVLEPKEIFLGAQYKTLGQEMAENGVFFLSGQKEGKFAESFAAMYKGEIIAEFTKAEMPNFYKKWKNVKKDKLGDTLEELSQTLQYENGRMGYVDGLFDNIDVNYKPKGFESLKDIEDFDPKYGRGIETRFADYEGYFYRNFDAKKKIFTFNHGFLLDLPKWVEDVKIPLVLAKGIPTQAYYTLRQMKLLDIVEGEIQTVRMAQIQNLETMGYIHQVTGGKIIRNFDSVDILAAPSNEYMKTVMIQAGYETQSGRIIGQGQYFSVKQLKSRQWDISDEFMKKYNLSESSMLYMNFNIEVKVKYVKK